MLQKKVAQYFGNIMVSELAQKVLAEFVLKFRHDIGGN